MITEAEIDKLKIIHPDGKGRRAIPCFELCFFYIGTRKTAKLGYAEIVTSFIEREASNLKWFKTNTMRSCKVIKGSAIDQMKSFILSSEFEKDGDLGLEQHSGSSPDSYSVPSVKLFSEQVKGPKGANINRTFIRLCVLPNRTSDSSELLELATICAKAEPLYCGHGGFSWYWNTGDTILEEEIGSKKGLLLRHPCMGYSDPFTFHSYIGQGLIQVGWLTFLGGSLVEKIGTSQEIRKKLATSVEIMDLGKQHGIIMVAGEKPILGSNNPKNKDSLAPYRAVGQATNSVRLPNSAFDFMDIPGFDDEEDLQSWYLRFFGK